MLWRREWLSTLVFLPGEFHGKSSLVDYSPWSHKESGTTEWLTLLLPSPVCSSFNMHFFTFPLSPNSCKSIIRFILIAIVFTILWSSSTIQFYPYYSRHSHWICLKSLLNSPYMLSIWISAKAKILTLVYNMVFHYLSYLSLSDFSFSLVTHSSPISTHPPPVFLWLNSLPS